jgi:O-antigen/teichoic acid export membrane protein
MAFRGFVLKTYKHYMGDSLYRNSIYLLSNMGITAITGFAFWIIAARLFTTAEVGKATALIAAISLVASLSGLGLTRTVIRFLTKSNNRSQDIATKIILSIFAATVFSIIISFFLPHLRISHVSRWVILLFIASGIISVLKNLLDTVFIAFRASHHTLIENTTANVSKLCFIFLMTSMGYIGIFVSQIGAALLAVLVCLFLLSSRHEINFRAKPSIQTMSGLWSFSIGSYMNDIIGFLPNTVIPLLVIHQIGATNAALWYIAMQIYMILFLIGSSVNESFLAEASHKEEHLRDYMIRATKGLYAALIPAVLFVIIFAPMILGIFGEEYRQAVPLLRILALTSIMVAGSFIAGTVLTIFKKIWYLAITNVANAVVVIGGCLTFGKSLDSFGSIWFIGEVVNLLLFGIGALYILQRKQIPFWSGNHVKRRTPRTAPDPASARRRVPQHVKGRQTLTPDPGSAPSRVPQHVKGRRALIPDPDLAPSRGPQHVKGRRALTPDPGSAPSRVPQHLKGGQTLISDPVAARSGVL